MRFIKWFLVLAIVLFLSACTADNTLKHDTVFNELRLIYALDDSEFSVKEDVLLPENTYEGATFDWTSSNSNIAAIVDNKVVITRGDFDTTVSILLKLTINGKTEAKSYTFTVIKKEETALKTYNVYVIDGSDATLYQVTENEYLTLEEPTKIGYEFAGFYTDSTFKTIWDQGAITKTSTIYIKWTEVINIDETAPIITGHKDLSLTVGEIIDYSLGITIYDERGEDITLEIDDHQVDITTPGVYDLYYKAADSSGNETQVSVKVTVVEVIQTISFLETFESVSGSSSSYTNGEINSQGITWYFVGMRNDQSLDGKAITFGANSNNYLKAQMTGGIDTFKVDFAPAFTGSNSRQVDLYINNTLKHSFYVTNSQTTYEVTNLGISGDYLLELRNTGGYRVTVDNIQISNQPTSPDLNAINLDIKAYNLPTNILKESHIPLYQTGLNGSTISYAYQDLTNPSNHLIDLSTGLVLMPTSNQVTVEIKITFTKGLESKTITKALLIGEGNPITVLQARNQVGYVKLQATLTGYMVEETHIRAFFEDNTSAIEVLLDQTFLSQLTIGYQYILKGDITLSTYKVLSNVGSMTKGIYQPINPTEVTSVTAGLNQSRYVYLTGLVKKDYATGNLEVISADGSIEISNQTTSDLFLNAKLGQEVSLNGFVFNDGQSVKIYILDALAFELRALNEAILNEKILTALGLSNGMTVTNSITLLTIDPLFNLSVSYTSSHPSVLSNTGQVIIPEVDTLVMLSYDIKNGSETILTGSIQLDILSTPALTPYYQSAQGLTGASLLAELTKIISRNYNGISYTATNKVLEIADKHPSGVGYLGIYDHVSITSYNKEHVWPQSSFSEASPYKSDMHHLRISNSNTNSTRSNYYFNNPTSQTSDWQVGSSRFFPGDLDKGDIARMLMYMAVRYRNDNFRLIIADSGRTSNPPARTMGNLAVLYDWHIEDPVDAFEENRNEVIFGTQNNRNPFIDHPELFYDVWSYFMAENGAPQNLSTQDNGYFSVFQSPTFTNLSNQLG